MRVRMAAMGLALACVAGQGHARETLEVIELRHATVEQVLPALRPLLAPGGVLTGQSGRLIVRSSEANIAELRQALAAIDRPRRRLEILVRLEDGGSRARESVEARGRIDSRRGSRVEIGAEARQGSASERVDQRVQVLEGGRALIATGAARPLVQRQTIRTPSGVRTEETVVLQEAASGIEVTPRLVGDTVVLELAQRRDRLSPDGATVRNQSLETAVRGRLGEWIDLGGLSSSDERSGRALAGYSRESFSATRRIWVKVRELP